MCVTNECLFKITNIHASSFFYNRFLHVFKGGISYQESSEEDKAEALRLKNEGNDLLRTGNFVQALELYKQCVQLFII